jgi:hypothetical protein
MEIIKKINNSKSWRGCGEQGPFVQLSYTIGRNSCNYYGNQYGGSSKPYDTTIPLLGVYLKECK